MSTALTAREVRILRIAASGKKQTAIAGELDISTQTLKNHLSHIYRKLDVEGLVGALNALGWITPDETSHLTAPGGELDQRIARIRGELGALAEEMKAVAGGAV